MDEEGDGSWLVKMLQDGGTSKKNDSGGGQRRGGLNRPAQRPRGSKAPNPKAGPQQEAPAANQKPLPSKEHDYLERFYQRITSVPREVKPYCWQELKQLSSAEPEVILEDLLKDGRFFKFLESDYISNEAMETVLRLLDFICQCYQTHFENLQRLLTRVLIHEKFIKHHLCRYLSKCNQHITSHLKTLVNFGTFFLYSAKLHPASTALALKRLEPNFQNILGKLQDQETTRLYTAINDHISDFEKNKSKAEIEKLSRLDLFHCIEPETSFRSLQQLPSLPRLLEEPFVRPNLYKGKYSSIEHYLDVQYRLFQEDMLRYLRQGIQEYRKCQSRPERLNLLNNVNVYQNCEVNDVFIVENNKRQYIIKFQAKQLELDWESSSRFTFGSLIALSTDNFETSLIYGSVDERNIVSLKKGKLPVSLKKVSEQMQKQLLVGKNITLVETSVFLLAYLPPLSVLNSFSDVNPLPFSDYIVFGDTDVKPPQYLHRDALYDLRPLCQPFPKAPQQSMVSDEEIMLNFILNKEMPTHQYEFTAKCDRFRSVQVLDQKAWPRHKELGFDEYQLKAFKSGITKEFALIQGPPGTGKTYIGLRLVQVLLHNRQQWGGLSPSPILVVCFKNHALDQFLEELLPLTTKVIRIGTNSKSEVLLPYMLKNITEYCRPQIGDLNNKIAQISDQHNEHKELVERSKKLLVSFSHLKDFMIDQHLKSFEDYHQTNICSGAQDDLLAYWLCAADSAHGDVNQSSIEILKNRMLASKRHTEQTNKRYQPFKKEEELLELDCVHEMREYSESRSGGSKQHGSKEEEEEGEEESFVAFMLRTCRPMYFSSMENIENIWALDYEDRWRLYCFWVAQLRAFKQFRMDELMREKEEALDKITDYVRVEKLSICKSADVIGITTSGAAIQHDLLMEIKPSIILIEEAAEILEAHTISCLTKDTDHVIFIGDHKQLQPTTSVHDLTINYDLHISLFERVINNGVEANCLVSQHRMRPDIAHLLHPTFYPILKNDQNVREYESIQGMANNIFFLSHKEHDEKRKGTTSFYNTFEAKFLYELSKYFIYQGYKASQITILATYTGQVFQIKELVENCNLCKAIRVTTVDNFQGEENDIILISFVRSNDINAIGFLEISNRVCVALSRARKGLYCIGNFALMASKSKLWESIYLELCNQDAINNLEDERSGLKLVCKNHPGFPLVVRKPEDFERTNMGGCRRNCEYRFECDHVCPLTCHIFDREHKLTRCQRPCEKIVCKSHPCSKVCSRPCGDCEVLVFKALPLCGHQAKMACSRDPLTFVCSLKCTKKLPCRDICQGQCGQVCPSCKVEKPVLARCQHLVKVECYLSKEEAMFRCKEKCQARLECGHFCQGTCKDCCQGRLHQLCKEKCNKILLCGHLCQSLCYEICPPCPENCREICAHSHCPRKCGNRCIPCNKSCTWSCPHLKCTNKCNEYCNRIACNESCPKLREDCGHRCTGFCGEPCPDCPICHDDDDLTAPLTGAERFISLKECNHRVPVKQLASMFSSTNAIEAVQIKECPFCKTAIYKNERFKNQIMKIVDNIFLIIERVFGTLNERTQKAHEIIERIEKVRTIAILMWFPATSEILANLISKTKDTRSLQDLAMILNILEILEFAGKFAEFLDLLDGKDFPFKSSDLEYLEDFLVILRSFSETLGYSQMLDIQQEARRLVILYHIIQWRRGLKYTNYGVDQAFAKVHGLILKLCPFTRSFENEICALFMEALRKQEDDENALSVHHFKLMPILKAVRNHWFACENGHFLWKQNAKTPPPTFCELCKA